MVIRLAIMLMIRLVIKLITRLRIRLYISRKIPALTQHPNQLVLQCGESAHKHSPTLFKNQGFAGLGRPGDDSYQLGHSKTLKVFTVEQMRLRDTLTTVAVRTLCCREGEGGRESERGATERKSDTDGDAEL